MTHVRWLSRKCFVILALILFAFILGYVLGGLYSIWRIGDPFYSLLPRIEGSTSDLVIDVNLRGYYLARDSQKYDTEADSGFSYVHKRIPVNEGALILVDVWESHPNEGWLERSREITSTTIYEVLQTARENNMLIIHAPADGAISDIVSPLVNEIVVDYSNWIPDDIELHLVLQRHNVKTLFYVGFSTNRCLLVRPCGIKRMHSLGYQIILLRDCTTGFEYHDTLEGMWATKIAVRQVEELGYTCTAKDFIEGFTN